MQFTNLIFILYFLPVVLGVYYLVKKNTLVRNVWLLLASLVFYFSIEPYFVFAMLAMILLNYLLALAMSNPKKANAVYWLAIGLNFAALFAVKYWDFLLETIFSLSQIDSGLKLGIILPVGASFLFLRAISYLTDIKRGKTKPTRSFVDIALWFCFFPTVIIGPFVKLSEFTKKLKSNEHSVRRFSVGACRFVVGLAKKVILASVFIQIYTRIFNLSTIGITVYSVPALLAWLGALTYLLAIYYDLSAYFDMSVGLCLMLGIKIEEEMDYPLAKGCVTEFFASLFKSLFGWFDEYVFNPLLSKSIKNKDSVVRNTLLMWILIGLFFGASWNKLLWAMGIVFILIAEDFFNLQKLKAKPWYLHIYTIIVLSVLFVVFGTIDLYQAGIYLSNMVGGNYNGIWSPFAAIFIKEYFVYYLLGILFSMPIANAVNELSFNQKLGKAGKVLSYIYPIAMLVLFILCISRIISGNVTEFLFQRF